VVNAITFGLESAPFVCARRVKGLIKKERAAAARCGQLLQASSLLVFR
jgi:hypothetical protein